ncbi:MAG: PSP1 domain-containing protein [Oscillochloridaceae bacterium umkhey_bin13]
MPVVIGIRFKDSGKIYFFDPRDLTLSPGEQVIVETVRGHELARVAYAPREVAEDEIVGELKPVVRRAEPTDLERLRTLQARHDEVLARCAEKVREHSLPMNLVKAEYSFDGSRLTFYFTAEKRVDFRLLVRDLARTFKSRIELRQIGPRDEAKLLGGLGPCGRVLCCASFLPDYARVSIKMAKDQDLPLNPAKISGVCGRLLCCLSYEHEQYVEMRAELPRKGTWVQTPDGPGEVIGQLVLKQQLLVQLVNSGMQETYDLTQIEIATTQVAALARSRNAEGITPVSQAKPARPPERDRGERRKLRDEIEQYELIEGLDLLEDDDDLRPPLEEPAARPAPPARRNEPPRQELAPRPPKDKDRGQAPPRQPQGKPQARSNEAAPPAPPAAQAAAPADPAAPRRRRRRGGRGGSGSSTPEDS